MELLFFPVQFPPTRGGIATWMYSVCSELKEDGITVLTEGTSGSKDFDNEQGFEIIRTTIEEKPKFTTLARFLLTFISSLKDTKIDNLVKRDLKRSIRFLNHRQLSYALNVLLFCASNTDFKRTELIFCGYALPAGIAAMFLKFIYRIPYAIFVHGMELFSSERNANERNLMVSILSNADGIIANSRYTSNLLTEKFGIEDSKINIIHPGVDFARFAKKHHVSTLKSKLGITNERVILTVANLVERKGHDIVLKALPNVLCQVPDLKYIIVGDGGYRRQLESYIQEYDLEKNVFFTGAVPDGDLPTYYHLCDVFVMPGRVVGIHVEGFGIAYVEAGACAKPVIGGCTGGTQDAIIDGVTGILVNPEDETEISQAMLKLLTNKKLADKLGKNGKRRAEQELSWEITANKVKQVAEQILTDQKHS